MTAHKALKPDTHGQQPAINPTSKARAMRPGTPARPQEFKTANLLVPRTAEVPALLTVLRGCQSRNRHSLHSQRVSNNPMPLHGQTPTLLPPTALLPRSRAL